MVQVKLLAGIARPDLAVQGYFGIKSSFSADARKNVQNAFLIFFFDQTPFTISLEPLGWDWRWEGLGFFGGLLTDFFYTVFFSFWLLVMLFERSGGPLRRFAFPESFLIDLAKSWLVNISCCMSSNRSTFPCNSPSRFSSYFGSEWWTSKRDIDVHRSFFSRVKSAARAEPLLSTD